MYRITEGHGQLVLPDVGLMFEGQEERAPHWKQKGKGGAMIRLCEHQCNLVESQMP